MKVPTYLDSFAAQLRCNLVGSCRLLGLFCVEECIVRGSFVEGHVGPLRVVEPNLYLITRLAWKPSCNSCK